MSRAICENDALQLNPWATGWYIYLNSCNVIISQETLATIDIWLLYNHIWTCVKDLGLLSDITCVYFGQTCHIILTSSLPWPSDVYAISHWHAMYRNMFGCSSDSMMISGLCAWAWVCLVYITQAYGTFLLLPMLIWTVMTQFISSMGHVEYNPYNMAMVFLCSVLLQLFILSLITKPMWKI